MCFKGVLSLFFEDFGTYQGVSIELTKFLLPSVIPLLWFDDITWVNKVQQLCESNIQPL